MRRRTFLIYPLALGALKPAALHAQTSRLYRIGYLHPQSDTDGGRSETSGLQIIVSELARLGYVEGKTVVFEIRFADGDAERMNDLAVDLVRRKVDIIVAQTTTGALAAKRATATIPIVFTSSGDAVGSGLVVSLARPGGNATGNSFLGNELAIKQLELIREISPLAARLAFVGNASLAPEPLFFQQMQEPARRLKFEIIFFDVRGPHEFSKAVARLLAQKIQAAIWAPGGYTDRAADRVKLLAAKAGLSIPSMYFRREFVELGGLLSFGPSFPDLHRKAAVYIDRILKGEHPAHLPVEQPTKFELVVNLKTAQKLGLKIPETILLRADNVVE